MVAAFNHHPRMSPFISLYQPLEIPWIFPLLSARPAAPLIPVSAFNRQSASRLHSVTGFFPALSLDADRGFYFDVLTVDSFEKGDSKCSVFEEFVEKRGR